MRALQVSAFDGPDAVVPVDIPEPPASRAQAQGDGVVIEVHAAGVAFPDVLLSRGLYQMKAELPFVPGMEVAGIVRAAPADAGFCPGDRVAAFTELGGFAEVAVAPVHLTFKLLHALDFSQGAGLVLNYHTAVFALVTRGRLRAGEQVLVHGGAGGVGTATFAGRAWTWGADDRRRLQRREGAGRQSSRGARRRALRCAVAR
jgi:NADPH2:quinone reductase